MAGINSPAVFSSMVRSREAGSEGFVWREGVEGTTVADEDLNIRGAEEAPLSYTVPAVLDLDVDLRSVTEGLICDRRGPLLAFGVSWPSDKLDEEGLLGSFSE